MKVLVIGSGGREHAMCWKLSASLRRPDVFCAPGNAGTSQVAKNVPIAADDLVGLLTFARRERMDLTIVGPEDPLCAGIVDQFEAAGLKIFGPCASAARLEGDKAFAKQLMRDGGVPTAECRVFGPTLQELAQAKQAGRDKDEAASPSFQSGYDMARHYVSTRDEGIVIKASGLAKGKGVFVHPDPADALLTLEALMVHRKLGDAGRRVVIEEQLHGREVSVLALIDGQTIYMLETASDHKRLGENETGPNTGGMGAYSPSDVLTEGDLATIEREVFVPIVDALRRDDVVYRGVLYAGIMMTAGGPKVLEFNCRFGDPETQPILMRMETDLLDVLEATVNGTLDQMDLKWKSASAVCVVMASGGYPDDYAKGHAISGLNDAESLEGVQVFHAGTALHKGEVVTAGGRVLGVTALGENVGQARQRVYEATQKISFQGAYLRGDIGMRVSGR